MTPERWRQIKMVMDAALALEIQERRPYLDRACGADADLRFEVESLLASLDGAGPNFLKAPDYSLLESAASVNGTGSPTGRRPLPLEAEADFIGHRLGPYEIISRIGMGGMGEVYRAVRADDEYRKEVAIKLVRAGYGAEPFLNRFRNERQILATLEHPHISRLLDGGTTQNGLPYLVMEFIEGQPIDEYCQQRKLTVADRLRLFLEVCSAVQYAHQRLIIHRDLKPANILVTEDGNPKLLDFGIAKVLDPNAAETRTMTLMRAMTPVYASPEQVRGEPITTASDVYSLNVVLYELLAGRSPYRIVNHTIQEVTRAICEQQPLRPSTAARQLEKTEQGEPVFDDAARVKVSQRLRGDLDNILLMALRKEPQRRYASAEQFAEDIRRHQQKLPVIARRGTARYRAGRFILRHKAGVAAAAVTAFALIGGLIVSLHEARVARAQAAIAEQQNARAERRFNDVRTLANSLMFELHDSIKDLPGSTPARKLLVSRALQYLDSLAAEARNDASLQRELAAAYERIGDVQGQPWQANLGDSAGAAVSYGKALTIRESLAAANPGDVEVRRQLLPSYGKLSDLRRAMGDYKGAVEYSRKALAAAEALNTGARTAVDRMTFAASYIDYGYKQAMLGGDRQRGIESLQKGSAILEQVVAEDPTNLPARRILGLGYSRLAEILGDETSRRAEALAFYKKALVIKQGLVEAEPTNAELRRLVAYDKFAVGQLLANMKQDEAALAQDRQALAELQKLASADPENAQLKEDLGRVREGMGEILLILNQPAAAIEQFRQSIASLEKLLDAKNVQTAAGFTVLSDQLGMGKAYVRLDLSGSESSQEAAQYCRQAQAWLHKSLAGFQEVRDHAPPQYAGAAKVGEITSEMAKCGKLSRAAGTAQ